MGRSGGKVRGEEVAEGLGWSLEWDFVRSLGVKVLTASESTNQSRRSGYFCSS